MSGLRKFEMGKILSSVAQWTEFVLDNHVMDPNFSVTLVYSDVEIVIRKPRAEENE